MLSSHFFNTQRSPIREEIASAKLQSLSGITVTLCPKAEKKEVLSPKILDLGSPPRAPKASRSYSSDASDEDQHKAKRFKGADVKKPHLVG